jgi:hypothetical protein
LADLFLLGKHPVMSKDLDAGEFESIH